LEAGLQRARLLCRPCWVEAASARGVWWWCTCRGVEAWPTCAPCCERAGLQVQG